MIGLGDEMARDEALLDALGAREPVDDALGSLLSAWASTCDEPRTVVIPISRGRRRRRGLVIGVFALAVAAAGGSAAAANDPSLPVIGVLFGGLFDRSGDEATGAVGPGPRANTGANEGPVVGDATLQPAEAPVDGTIGLPHVGLPEVDARTWFADSQTPYVMELPGSSESSTTDPTASSTHRPSSTSHPTSTARPTSTAHPTSTARPTPTTHPTGTSHPTSTHPGSSHTPGGGRPTDPHPGATPTPAHGRPTETRVPSSRPTTPPGHSCQVDRLCRADRFS